MVSIFDEMIWRRLEREMKKKNFAYFFHLCDFELATSIATPYVDIFPIFSFFCTCSYVVSIDVKNNFYCKWFVVVVSR